MVKDDQAIERLGSVILELISDTDKLARLSENVAKLGLPKSDELIANEVFKLVDNK